MMPCTLIITALLSLSPTDGRRLFSEGKFPEAAQAFTLRPTAESMFNRACALLEAGDYPGAIEAYRAVDTSFPHLAPSARFNLAHALYKSAMAEMQPRTVNNQLQPGDLGKALDLLHASAAAFRAVLDVAPRDLDAARNTELVRRLIAQIQDQLEEQQRQQQQMQDAADRMEQLADAQQQQADQTRTTPPSRSREQLEAQQELNKQTQQAAEELEELLDQNPELRDLLEQAMESQSDAMEELAVSRTDRAAPEQQSAADKLRALSDALRQSVDQQPQDQQNQGEPQQQQQQQDALNQPATEQPKSAEQRHAEQILEQERQQRRELENLRRMLSRPVHVERDW